MRRTIAQRGRPRNEDQSQVKTEDKSVKFTLEAIEALNNLAAETSISANEHIRRAVKQYLEPKPVKVEKPGYMGKQLRYLDSVPCGNWEEAYDQADSFVVSEDVAKELGVETGDIAVHANGESMEGEKAGIPNGALVIMRPIKPGKAPQRGNATLVQIALESGEYQGTIKVWAGLNKLQDGDGNDFPIPPDTVSLIPVAELVGFISRRRQ